MTHPAIYRPQWRRMFPATRADLRRAIVRLDATKHQHSEATAEKIKNYRVKIFEMENTLRSRNAKIKRLNKQVTKLRKTRQTPEQITAQYARLQAKIDHLQAELDKPITELRMPRNATYTINEDDSHIVITWVAPHDR